MSESESTTTQILFNSPALHSLKRDQLVKLCKIHSLKASGKSKDLIRRLRFHAKTLPLDDPLSIVTRRDKQGVQPTTDSEDETSDHSHGNTPVSNTPSRPSEQWEVVMDTIAEVDEETLRSNRGASSLQAGEFGTHSSKASVTSSLRAIATSLGLARNSSKSGGTTSSSSSLSSKDNIQSSSTLPTSDPGGGPGEPPVEPIPGQSNLRGLPAPSDARLSLSQAPATTTIRLVSNPTADSELLLSPPKLRPFATSFDLVPGTPGGAENSKVPVWPFSPGGGARESLYPSIPTFQGFGDLLHRQQSPQPTGYDNSDMDIDIDMPGGLAVPSIREPTPEKTTTAARFNTGATPNSAEKPSAEPVDIFSPAPKPHNASTRSRLAIPRSRPFVFGSPLPQHSMSNLQFRTAAQSVLDEMNKRLVEEGVETVDADVLNKRRTATEDSTEKQESKGPDRAGDMFERIHQREFDKMDSITSHYAAKRGAPSTSSQPILSKKRKSSLVVKERTLGAPAARHRPNGYRVASGASIKTLPGDFGENGDEDEEIADRRMSKRPRVEREESDVPAQSSRISLPPPPNPEEETKKQKEREAIRRRLEHNKAKRRSSMGRPSIGRAPPPQAKPARFGFFASAKSLVQNVWNRGAGSKAPSNIVASKPAHVKVETKLPPKTAEAKKAATISGSSSVSRLSSQTKRIPSGGSNSSVQLNTSARSTLAPPVISGTSGETTTSSRIWKSSSSAINPPGSSAADAKSSTVAGHARPNNGSGSLVGFSSLGSRTDRSSNNSRLPSMGTKSNVRNPAASLPTQAAGIPRTRTTSTLMAPTASSLAKMNNVSRTAITAILPNENSTVTKPSTSSKQQHAMSPQPSATLDQITNSPRSPVQSSPMKIFSQPFSPPSARPPMSLTAAAASVVGRSTEQATPSPSKPRVLSQAKALPGRKPRISRSKIIARLASQRAASAGSGTSESASAERTGGKVRSSMGAEVAGKTRQSHSGTRDGDLLMSAKKRVRQSELTRRSRASDRQMMDVD